MLGIIPNWLVIVKVFIRNEAINLNSTLSLHLMVDLNHSRPYFNLKFGTEWFDA